jgi:hypothetical protein
MRRLIGIQAGSQQGGDIGGVLNMVTPRRIGPVVGVDAAIVDRGQACQQAGDRRCGRH